MANRPDIATKIKNARAAIAAGRSSPEHMPCWAAGMRVMPIEYVTLGVFGAPRPSAKPEAVRRRRLQAADGRTVEYTGFLLGQTHADLLMAVLELVRGRAVGERVCLEARALERLIGGRGGTDNVEAVRDHLAELSATSVAVLDGDRRGRFGGSLLPWYRERDGVLWLDVHAELVELVLEGYKPIDIAARRRLARKPLAQWLQVRLEGERQDWLELAGLQQLSRASGEAREFRRSAGAACEALDEARAGVGRWHVAGDDRELLVRAA